MSRKKKRRGKKEEKKKNVKKTEKEKRRKKLQKEENSEQKTKKKRKKEGKKKKNNKKIYLCLYSINVRCLPPLLLELLGSVEVSKFLLLTQRTVILVIPCPVGKTEVGVRGEGIVVCLRPL